MATAHIEALAARIKTIITATVGKQATQQVTTPLYAHKCFELTIFSIEASLFEAFATIKPHIVNLLNY